MTPEAPSRNQGARIKADAAYWSELAAALGWTLHGFTFREHASFSTGAQSLASINRVEREDIMFALATAEAEAAQRVVERIKERVAVNNYRLLHGAGTVANVLAILDEVAGAIGDSAGEEEGQS